MKAPLVEVIDHRREDRSGRVEFPNGDVAWLCGVTVSVDTLRCGHVIEVAGGGTAKRRRCPDCAAAAQLPLTEP